MDHPSRFTFDGRLLILLTLILAVGGTAAYITLIHDELSPGSYPIWFFAVPVCLGAVVFFLLGLGLMKWLGIPFYKDNADD